MVAEKKDWLIRDIGFSEERITNNGNKFLCGNGYVGIRGSLEEFEKEHLPAINLAGIYDQVGDGWREPLNAPNGLYTRIKIDGDYYDLPAREAAEHEQSLDYRHGIVTRVTKWKTRRGNITVTSERFAHYDEFHLICMRYSVFADFHADVEILTGIDGDVWDIHGPHYNRILLEENGDLLYATGITHESKDQVTVVEGVSINHPCERKQKKEGRKILHRICLITEENKNINVDKMIAVYTSKDCEKPDMEGQKLVNVFLQKGYEVTRNSHIEAWENHWKTAEVYIDGDAKAMEALNYSLYHLQCIAPRHSESLSIAARGLSGQTYKGAVFWDTEMFMLDYFLYTQPEVAKTLLRYRIDTLDGAKKKAAGYGYQGAFYAWESQEGGYDACSDYNVTDVFTKRPMRTHFKDKQIHISAAIVYGIMRYVNVTGDTSLLEQGGFETILECANFYESLLVKKVKSNQYELHDVIGPDEYHERVNNNGYTNRMAKYTFEVAAKLLDDLVTFSEDVIAKIGKNYNVVQCKINFQEAAERVLIPQPDEKGVIEQFEGYHLLEDVSVEEVKGRLLHEKEYWGGAYGVASQTQVIKQADVVTWLTMFPDDFSEEVMLKNWKYYEPRTEHGSSLSACMYALLACRCGMPEKAYPFFMKSASADLLPGGKEWAGLVYIGGTHPAAAGGAYMTAIRGFGGIYVEDGKLKAKPQLPEQWKKLRFTVQYQDQLYEITETKDSTEINIL
ncbi:glycosyl hydrolase family 65 protein [Anaerosporobacter sp.]|uniref:glycosyl hydrolase family 65 protein n=1 Tax=Anaerosporobacter sp. TaxID=1872529 RepID=UPI00286EC820|nr:glycosyl hydrolase family 65 protein [Anaerosporobacter sp.]